MAHRQRSGKRSKPKAVLRLTDLEHSKTDLAAGIRRVKGAKRLGGVRIGNWLTVEQSKKLLAVGCGVLTCRAQKAGFSDSGGLLARFDALEAKSWPPGPRTVVLQMGNRD